MTDIPQADRSDQLSAESQVIAGVTVVALHGEIDHGVQGILRQALERAGATTPPRVVADLGGVTFMDSSGINVLIHAHQRMSSAQGWLRIAGAQDSVSRLLHIVGVDTFIECHPAVEQALTA